ncbi:unnamed protein product [Danaus chrysippus]|uniref:(African queen) hypothetical protein n=1 Tax=Danaus chrysippus TaxID=151541 RepID=A0A8J2VWN5_9NEOP|nr:unnamed protein product [Danaus chrysippus]
MTGGFGLRLAWLLVVRRCVGVYRQERKVIAKAARGKLRRKFRVTLHRRPPNKHKQREASTTQQAPHEAN